MDREIKWRIVEWTTFFPSPTDPFYPRQSWNLAGELVGGFSATFTSQTFILAAIDNCTPPPTPHQGQRPVVLQYKHNPIILISLCVCIKRKLEYGVLVWEWNCVCLTCTLPLFDSLCLQQNRVVPRMYALFFHRLSILERATDHKCIKECSYSKKKCG